MDGHDLLPSLPESRQFRSRSARRCCWRARSRRVRREDCRDCVGCRRLIEPDDSHSGRPPPLPAIAFAPTPPQTPRWQLHCLPSIEAWGRNAAYYFVFSRQNRGKLDALTAVVERGLLTEIVGHDEDDVLLVGGGGDRRERAQKVKERRFMETRSREWRRRRRG